MAPKKGQGKPKGKQPAKRAAPVSSPPASSLDEEDWPVWQQLLSRMEALERSKGVEQPQEQRPEGQRGSTRPSKAWRRARLREVAANLTAQFDVLEQREAAGAAEQDREARQAAEEPERSTEDRRTPAEEAAGGSHSNVVQPDGDGTADNSELACAPDTTQQAAWPWPDEGTPRGVAAGSPVTQVGLHSLGQGDARGGAGPVTVGGPPQPWGLSGVTAGSSSPAQQAQGVGAMANWPPPAGGPGLQWGYGATMNQSWQGAQATQGSQVNAPPPGWLGHPIPTPYIRSWANWLPAYTIYMSVVLHAHPWRAQAMVKYQDMIYKAFADFTGHAWLDYDQQFRMRAATQPYIRWDQPLPDLWLQIMTPARPVAGERYDSGHLIRKNTQSPAPRPTAGQQVQPRLVCWDYNGQGSCHRKQCKFRHECSVCGAQYSAAYCSRARGPQAKPREGGAPKRTTAGSNPPAPKGPQPNQG